MNHLLSLLLEKFQFSLSCTRACELMARKLIFMYMFAGTYVMLRNHFLGVQSGTTSEHDSSPQLRVDLLTELQQDALLQDLREFPAWRDG